MNRNNPHRRLSWLSKLALLLLVTTSLSAAANDVEGVTSDPWEGFNRKIFVFNDYGDRYFLRPIAQGYHYVLPDPVESGISNVFSNASMVITMVNDVLQLKFDELGHDSSRFLINTTLGLLGVFDVASSVGLHHRDEDFGQTLGYYGVPTGPYLVLPFLGSSTVRDGLSRFPDSYVSPVGNIDHVPTRNELYGLNIISSRAGVLNVDQLVSGDRYVFIRDAYLQHREWLVQDGNVTDDFGDEDYDEFDDIDDLESVLEL